MKVMNGWLGDEDNKIICYLRVILRQWFSLRGRVWGVITSPRAHLAMCGNIFGFHNWVVLLPPSGWRLGMLLKPYGTYRIGHAPTTYNQELFGPKRQ